MGVRDKLRNIGNYVRKRWPSTDPDSYYQYKQGVSASASRKSRGASTQSADGEAGSVRGQSGSVSTKSAIRLSAQRRSRERRHLAVTRASPNDGSSAV